MINIYTQNRLKDALMIFEEKPWLFIWFMFFLSVTIKLFVVLPFKGPVVVYDEILYVENAFALKDFSYKTPHYPPFYSLFLAIGTFFGDNFYMAMKIINVIISSSIVFPIWLLCKKMLNVRASFIIVAVSLLNPYQGSSSQLLMSEVLFYPLFIYVLYYFVNLLISQELKYYICFALLLAFCMLTRYISAIMLPAFGIVFLIELYRNRFKNVFTKKMMINLVVFAVVFILILVAFYLPYFDHFFKMSSVYTKPIKNVAFDTVPLNETFFSLLIKYIFSPPRIIGWFLIYVSYFLLLIAPFLYMIIRNILIIYRERKTSNFNYYFMITSLICSFFFIVLATRHSSSKDYTQWYMLGRYIMFVFPIIIFSFINLDKYERKNDRKKSIILAFTFFIVSVLVIIFRLFGTAEYLLLPHVSPDVYVINTYWYITLPLIAVSLFLSMKNQSKFVYVVTIYCFLIFVLSFDINKTIELREARLINNNLKSNKDQLILIDHSYFVSDSTQGTNFKKNELLGYISFWRDIKNFSVSNFADKPIEEKEGLVLTNRIIPCEKRIDSIEVLNSLMFLYNYPFENSNRRIDLIEMIDSNKVDVLVTTKFSTDKPSLERNGIIHNFLVKNNLLQLSEIKDPFFYLFYSKCVLKYEHEIIMKSNQTFEFEFSTDSIIKYDLYGQFGFLNLIKEWNISDGMHLSVYYEDQINGKIFMFGDYFIPSLMDNIFHVPLPINRNQKFKIILDTSLSGLTTYGDGMSIKSLELVN